MQIKTAADIGRMVREARLQVGLSQKALAAQAATTQPWISEMENGKETAEIGMVLRILSHLGLTLDLSGGTSQPQDATWSNPDPAFPNIDAIVDAPPASR